MINELIINTLKPLNVPIGFQKYTGKKTTYITFNEYNQRGEGFEEDEEIFTGHYIQVDIWSKEDYEELVNKTKALLRDAGFKRLDEVDLYEKDTGLYHKGMRFFYLEEKEAN
ncbi:hypothetical protein EDC18_10557 [Natranaerovirga pectinivora]|uniref:Uncharacterized protein n=1 Tax=Natranaerovirga pectinivora TaxID=682400 RepID=A0A4R3MKU8_9FIRM|nr:hypothetical protein [Natranaerovirga pectinivora]TCT14576.1 hypothetical protein EDC18_10557 [Natranaerovirga pectinivora]